LAILPYCIYGCYSRTTITQGMVAVPMGHRRDSMTVGWD
jgi:hypothetical protein